MDKYIATDQAVDQKDPVTEGATTSLPKLLRAFGAAAILFSLYSFMMQGWDGAGDLSRYFILLAGTGLLSGIALACGHYLKEAKSPRVLMMLGLASCTANFSILGAFVYSVAGSPEGLAYPTYASWTASDAKTIFLSLGAAFVVLLPVMLVGFKTLSRDLARPLSGLFLLGNGLLLLPVRDGATISIMAIGAALALFAWVQKQCSHRPEMKTIEGAVAQAVLFLPVVIMLGRSILFYAPDETLNVIASLMAFGMLRHISIMAVGSEMLKALLGMASAVVALFAAAHVAGVLDDLSFSSEVIVFVSAALASGMIYETSTRLTIMRNPLRIFAFAVAAFAAISMIIFSTTLSGTVLVIGSGIGLAIFGFNLQQRAMFIAGGFMAICGLCEQAIYLTHNFDFNYWVVTAVAGIVAIVAAAFMESEGIRIKPRIQRLKNDFSEWDC